MAKRKKSDTDPELQKIGKIVKIHTLNIMVEIQTEDKRDKLETLKKMAEAIVDKYINSR